MRRLYFVVLVFLATGWPTGLAAQISAPNPHEKADVQTGVIVGTLFAEDKKAIGNHKVVLEIFHEKNFVLAIPKNTTKEGGYRFKNIFQRPEFSYIISTNYQGAIYRTLAVMLKPGEKERTVDLTMKAHTKAVARSQAQPSHPRHPVVKKRGWPFDVYQTLAIVLCVAAVGYVIFVMRRKSKPRA